MPLNFANDTVTADAVPTVEDALPLLEYLQSQAGARVDLGACTHLHTAVLQVLMAARPTMVTLPRDAFLARWLPGVLGDQITPSPALAGEGWGGGAGDDLQEIAHPSTTTTKAS